MLTLIDSHCHLDFKAFDNDRPAVLQHCESLGVAHIILPGVSVAQWPNMISLSQQFNQLSYALGCHPMFMTQHAADAVEQLDHYIGQYAPVAIGEIGLDFYLQNHDKSAQISLLEAQLALAVKHALPIILHVRKAHDEMLKLLRKYRPIGGSVHAFSGSLQQAQQYIELGFCLGIGGALTYPRANKLRSMFAHLPLSSIVLETDAPDMPLSGRQGLRNSPEYLPLIAQQLAELREIPVETVAKATTENSQRLFSLPAA
ncbi:TatD family hydrolase [Methylophaga lonarensis]|uniref:TatD family hydrolase n=1 Tax=Methylophaga lonarensis TaxID=999151 RepID=UPI003D2DD651